MNRLAAWCGRRLARYLTRPVAGASMSTHGAMLLAATLRPGDVLLVDGNTRISRVIRTLTQSNWSHAALCIGMTRADGGDSLRPMLLEADLEQGVRLVDLAVYTDVHSRICRPVGLTDADRAHVIDYARGRLGHRYDLKNVIDLARYLLPAPPVPQRWRRRLIALGSGDPTRAICSTLIAQAFQSVRYPILPDVTREKSGDPDCDDCIREYLHIRHYSLFTPRDFDLSPYFAVVKPTLEAGFDYRALPWHPDTRPADATTSR
jgi:hypothetical protein